jgi:hypothetical protein
MRAHWIVAVVALGAALMWLAAAHFNRGRPRRTEDGPDTSSSPATDAVVIGPAEPAQPAAAEPQAPAAATPSTQPASPIEQPTPAGPRAPERSGPIGGLEQSFASEPRASSAVGVESAIDAVFRRPEVPRALLKSVMCRSTVCKIETRWSPERAAGFMVALMQLVTQSQGEQRVFDHELGIAPEGEPDADGSRAIVVYLKYFER